MTIIAVVLALTATTWAMQSPSAATTGLTPRVVPPDGLATPPPAAAGHSDRDCTSIPRLELVPQDTCVNAGELLIVHVELTNYAAECPDILGGQFTLQYDPAVLDFLSAEPGGGLIVEEIYEAVDEIAGTIDYAVGTDPSSPMPGITAGTMAILTFTPIGDACVTSGLITFRSHEPPTRLTDEAYNNYDVPAGTLTLVDLPQITVDVSEPVLTCPADLNLLSEAGGCNDTDPGLATATDNCDTHVSLTWDRSDQEPDIYLNAPFCLADSPITITWTATDDCGNASQCVQTVIVNYPAELAVNVQLAGAVTAGPFTRCITFELVNCDTLDTQVVEAVLAFNGGFANALIPIVPGEYHCCMARDRLHTLRKTDTDDFGIVGPRYVADFTDQTGGGGDDSLLGGNVNDDAFVDIIDFGQWAIRYGDFPGADTNCTTLPFHVDFSGDGWVLEEDFSFVQINFWLEHEAACCGLVSIQGDRPRTSILVKELLSMGYGELAVMDLNADGWYDLTDVYLEYKKNCKVSDNGSDIYGNYQKLFPGD